MFLEFDFLEYYEYYEHGYYEYDRGVSHTWIRFEMPTLRVAESMMHNAITYLICNGHSDMGDAHTRAKLKACFSESSLSPLWLFVDEKSVHFCVKLQILQVTFVMVGQSPCVIIYLFLILSESLQRTAWKIFIIIIIFIFASLTTSANNVYKSHPCDAVV